MKRSTTGGPRGGWRSFARAAAVACAGAVVLSGCEASIYSAPLPGGPDVGEDPMEVTVEFRDVLDLVPQSTVKVNDITVGEVTAIDLKGYTALATLEVRDDVQLPDNAVAELRQTSLLGEKFVSLEAPEQGESPNALEDGDVIPLQRSGRNPEVEEVLGALSLLLNGGGVAQLKTITQELNNALEGREGAAKSVFRQLDTFVGEVDDNKEDIVDAIESLNRLALATEKQLPTIDAALEELPSALRSIDRQRDDLVKMLRSLNELSDVAVGVIRASKASTIESLEQLTPVLSQLAASGDDFVDAFNVALTYPFVDEVVGRDPQVARNLHMGDYTNLSVTLDVALTGEEDSLPLPDPGEPVEEVCTTLDDVRDELGGRVPLDELIRYLDSIDDLCDGARRVVNQCLQQNGPNAIRRCLARTLGVTINRITRDVLDNVCELPLSLPRLCQGNGGGSGGGNGGGNGGGLPGVPGLPGLGRSGALEPPQEGSRGPTYGQLMDEFDPALVSMLVPGMVLR